MSNDSDVIDRLGGTTEVARLCDVKPPSVSEWRKNGIPKARLQFLMLLRPDVFRGLPASNDDAGGDERAAVGDAPAEGEGTGEGAP